MRTTCADKHQVFRCHQCLLAVTDAWSIVWVPMKFTEFDLHPDLQRGIDEAQYVECTPVQEQTISRVIAGKDVTVQSQTGTGKTAAFLIPIFQQLMTSKQGAKALIIAPTRELAVQIHDEAKLLGQFLPVSSAAFYGGVGYADQEAALAKDPSIIIGTPGRLIDFDRSRKLSFGSMGILVLDEADRLFDMGFYPDIQSIIRKMKSRAERQTLLFSATMSTRVMNIAWEHMNNPDAVEIEPEHVTVELIQQTLYHLSREEKFPALLGIFRQRNPKNAIVFTNMKRTAEEIAKRLEINGFVCEFIMGDLPQSKRLKIISRLKSGDLKFLVATDVAARGLHINDLEMVVNYDLPEDPESYVHRIGRTARAGKSGVAVSFSDERYVYGLPAIESLIGFKIPVGTVSEELFGEDKSKGVRVLTDSRHERSGMSRGAGGDRRGGRREPRRQDSGRPAGTSTGGRGDSRSSGSGAGGSRSGGAVRRESAKPRPAKAPAGSRTAKAGPPRRNMTREERIAYYREKYGENFDESRIGGGTSSRNDKGSSTDKSAGTPAGKQNGKRRDNRRHRDTGTQARDRNSKSSRRPATEARQQDATRTEKQAGGGILGFLSRLFGKKDK